MEGDRHLLGRRKPPVIFHGQAHIQHEHRGSTGDKLWSIDFEVLGLDLHWGAGSLPRQRIQEGATEVRMEPVTVFIGLGGIGMVEIAMAMEAGLVGAELPLFEHVEDVAQRSFAKLANPSWSQLEAVPDAIDVARLL